MVLLVESGFLIRQSLVQMHKRPNDIVVNIDTGDIFFGGVVIHDRVVDVVPVLVQPFCGLDVIGPTSLLHEVWVDRVKTADKLAQWFEFFASRPAHGFVCIFVHICYSFR